jgi:hypothetical protein
MGRLLAVALGVALLGGAVAAYNASMYEIVQPIPLSWNHSADELRLIRLEQARRRLVSRMGTGQRVTSLAGAPLLGAPDDQDREALARLDAEIAILRTRVAAGAPR